MRSLVVKTFRFFVDKGPRYSLRKAIFLITFFSVAMSALSLASYLIVRPVLKGKARFAKEPIEALLVQSKEGGLALPCTFFAELLGLSIDAPLSFADLDLGRAEAKLEGLGLIKEAVLKRKAPHLLCVEYSMRAPMAALGNCTNTLFDEEGVLFPADPFFPPMRLPLVYLTAGEYSWGCQVGKKELAVLHILCRFLQEEAIEEIDLSRADHQLIGQREVVVRLRKGPFLRLATKDYEDQLKNYLKIEQSLMKEKRAAIVDLRLPKMAFIDYLEDR